MTPEQQKMLDQLAQLGEVKITTYTSDGDVINYVEDHSEEFEFSKEDLDHLPDCDFMEQKLLPIDPELLKEYKYAYGKLVVSEPAYLSKEDYIKWLNKFRDLFNNLGYYVHPDEKHYREVFDNLCSLVSYFENEEEAQKALLEFEIIDKENETQVLKWLVNYEDLGGRVFMMDVDFYDSYRHFQGDFVSVLSVKEMDYVHKVYFDLRDFKLLLNFQEAHNTRYWKMLEKYRIHTWEELNKFDQSSEEWANQSSLAYHLKKRINSV